MTFEPCHLFLPLPQDAVLFHTVPLVGSVSAEVGRGEAVSAELDDAVKFLSCLHHMLHSQCLLGTTVITVLADEVIHGQIEVALNALSASGAQAVQTLLDVFLDLGWSP